jgi:hypothetical protein
MVLLALFALAVVGLLAWFAYFASRTGIVLEQLSAVQALWLTTALSGGVALSPGLLAFHYTHEGYTAGEEVFFRACLIISTGILLCSGIWGALISLFG